MFGYCEGWLDDIEFLVLTELNTSENLDFPYDSNKQFNLDVRWTFNMVQARL